MEQHLFILLYFTGVIPLIQSIPRKYYLIQESMTWSDAQAYCRTHHTDLAIIESNYNLARLRNMTLKEQFGSNAWIGLYRELRDWYWTLNNEPLGSLRPWSSGEPGVTQWCGDIAPSGWGDGTCTSQTPFICFDETKTGDQRYIYISTTMSWHHAQIYCRNHHTDLASARDETENSIIMGLISGWSWTGRTKESWKWINRTTFSTISWESGQPDLTSSEESCGYINNGLAGDQLCTDTLPFICYRDVTGQQQIMRMEVKSDKDVNDPAVMDAIMKRIQKKLEEHGLAKNVTLKWRVQPDGKVFHKKKEDL